jgi:murein DD-endopeptidase MepM/ murein hydrolase activator NlpD
MGTVHRGRLALVVALALAFQASRALTAAPPPRTEAGAPLSLAGQTSTLPPGGVTLLSVTSATELTRLTGNAAGRSVAFWPTASRKEWQGLVGVALDTRPGPLVVAVRALGSDGVEAVSQLTLRVVPRQFETRRLRVDPKLAEPPAEEVARITREAKAMADTFAVVTPERLWRGPFVSPVPGTATSSFGRLSITNGKPAGRHQGADFRAATGTPVRAPNAGRVALAQNLYFAGNTVIVDHGLGVFSLVAHLSRIDVRAGDRVGRGEVLGESGATGRVTGPHLHWAVRFGDISVDPLALVAAVSAVPDEILPAATQ